MSLPEVNALVRDNHIMVLAASENVLAQIEKGRWIGGTIPYFMDVEGGCMSNDKVFVTDLTHLVSDARIRRYDDRQLFGLTADRYRNGFSWLLVPGFSDIHFRFALDVNDYPGIFDAPLMGWITGVDLADVGKVSPKIVDGESGQFYDNRAIALHCQLPDSKYAKLDIVNLFQQGDGDIITFPESGFSATQCTVNGEKMVFSDYLKQHKIDTRLPLVANYSGAMINISIQTVDDGKVSFYAPVVKNQVYKFAMPVKDYVTAFKKMIPKSTDHVVGSCNCILNYLYSDLEGKKTGALTGPFTFGEIAYVLVNQTLSVLSVEDLV